ncbi:MAG: hypothetical protein ACRCX2_02230 [Paraclostridium sp.]
MSRAFLGDKLIFGHEIPFEQPYPNENISMCLYADATGVRNWDSVNDQMPIKTINMAGIQKWEETEDYIIYLDKDAVMTTVEQYVTGAYDKFQDVKALIDTFTEMLSENGIEWTTEDDSKLFTDINDSMLEEIINTPTQLDEPTEIQTFTSKAVPTTYECCFRTDKKNGEIYIGEGYNNVDGVVPSGKPFVKSIMPSGKLAFVTGANSDTHTLITKDNSTFKEYTISRDENLETTIIDFREEELVFVEVLDNVMGEVKFNGQYKQILIYKGILTDAEKETEDAKEISLSKNTQFQETKI